MKTKDRAFEEWQARFFEKSRLNVGREAFDAAIDIAVKKAIKHVQEAFLDPKYNTEEAQEIARHVAGMMSVALQEEFDYWDLGKKRGF